MKPRLLFAVVLLLGCIDPDERRPGLWLSGERVEEAVTDWSFTDAHPQVWIQVATPYWVAHSVTLVCSQIDGQLYVGARNPSEKNWVSYVESDPAVRLKFGEKLYDVVLEVIDDTAEQERIRAAYSAKYGWKHSDPSERPPMRYYRVVPAS